MGQATLKCTCCYELRKEQKKGPRFLTRLSVMTAGENPNGIKYAIFGCEHCDGPLIRLSEAEHGGS